MKDLYLLLTLLLLIPSTPIHANTDKYYGKTSTEGMLTFKSRIQVPKDTSQKDALVEVYRQIPHLIGHFSSESFKESFGNPAVLGERYQITFTKTKTKGRLKTFYYNFKGKAVFHLDSFKNKKSIKVPLRLPYNLDKIYARGSRNGVNLCTDPHYNSEGDFFYFWDPDKEGCPLKNNRYHVVRTKGTVTKIQNTKKTYPEYHRLYKQKELNISIFLGYVNDQVSLTTVDTEDPAYETYQALLDVLFSQGYATTDSKERFKKDLNNKESKGIAFSKTLSKKLTTGLGNSLKVKIHILLSDTDVNSKDKTFHHFITGGMKNSDILVYDGHSGLGGNLNFDYLPSFNMTDKYQVFFINGCSSYPYFNGMFFRAKPEGQKNIEVVTSGLSTWSSTATDNILAFIDPFTRGELKSYQDLLTDLEESNGPEDTYLTGVNGDQDNQFTP